MKIKVSKRIDRFVKSGRQYIDLFDFPEKPVRYVNGLTWFMIGFLAGILIADWIISCSQKGGVG